jgi:hypothetical protein
MKQLFLQISFTVIIINSVFAINPKFYLEGTVRDSTHQNPFQRKSVTIGILLTHFSSNRNNNGSDYNIQFINPGAEALFHYSINKSICLNTGLSYQYNKITYWEHSPDIKSITNEISIPLLISLYLFQSTVSDMELTAGFYLGQYVSITNNTPLFENYKKNYAKLFSSDDFIGDIYASIGKNSILKKFPIGFDLFFRYRLKEHQSVNHYVSRSFYGIKLNYGFNL